MNQLLFAPAPRVPSVHRDSSKITEADLLDHNENWSFFFILQNNVDLPPETIEDQKERNLLFLNTCLPGKRRNYILKCRTLYDFQMAAVFQYDALDYLISQNKISLPRTNRYFFNFFMRPKMEHLNLPQSIPVCILMILKADGKKKRMYIGLKPANALCNDIEAVLGSQFQSATFFTQTVLGGEKKFFKILFT